MRHLPQVAGHHLSLNCLVIGRQMVLSPTFMGAEPTYIDEGPWAGRRLFQDEENLGLELMRSFDAGQRRAAILYHSSVGGDGDCQVIGDAGERGS